MPDPPNKPPDRPPPSMRRSAAKVAVTPTTPSSIRRPSTSSLRLPAIDFDLANAARRIIEGSLGVAGGERVVILVDRSRHDLGVTIEEVAKANGAKTVMLVL